MDEPTRPASEDENPGWLRRFLREPLVHFALLGAGIFAVHYAVTSEETPPPAEVAARRIELSAADVDRIARQRAAASGAAPTDEALRAAVEAYVTEEALFREAQALGLEEGDTVVRRRLVQKLKFLLEDAASLDEPTEEELAAHLAAHLDRYRAPSTVTFRHVFFARDGGGERAAEEARTALARLEAGADPSRLGDPFALGAQMTARPLARVAADFGAGFGEAVETAPLGEWTGPVTSSYGQHLVRVEAREPSRARTLSEARDEVRADLVEARRRAAEEEGIARIRAAYEVTVEWPEP